MGDSINNLNGDPSQLTIRQKVNLFEKSSEKSYKPLTFINNFTKPSAKRNVSSSDNNISTLSSFNTSTPISSGLTPTHSGYSPKSASKLAYPSAVPSKLADKISHIINDHKSRSTYYSNTPETQHADTSVNMQEFHVAIKDLDTFLVKELNEIEIQKRISHTNKEKVFLEKRYDNQILETLQKLKNEITDIKVSQKGFEDKLKKQEEYQYIKLNDINSRRQIQSESSVYDQSSENEIKTKKSSRTTDKTSSQGSIKGSSVDAKISWNQNKIEPPIITSGEYSRDQKISKLEAEIYKEETLMMKINGVLENLKNVDDKNLLDVVNIERHLLVASTRFQSALFELKKLKQGNEMPVLPQYNRRGKLIIKDIMLEVKSAYFQRPLPIRNEYLLIMMKYDDKVFATKPMQIIDDIRIMKFSERFSIPEIYMNFDIRMEIYGTTFWRKNSTSRATMLKKYGFVTLSLADTGSKRFPIIEVLQSENIPIRKKVVMKISQNLTTDVKYKGNLFVKIKDVWHEAYGTLNGHLLELSFKKIYSSGIVQSQETMLLDLYNVDNEAVIPVDVQRISDKSYTFLLKFNHYVDVANFYLMLAAESSTEFSEWVNALNKVLVLIK